MSETNKLLGVLDEMIVHPIVTEMLIEDIKNGAIKTEEQLHEKAEEYTSLL